MELRIRQGDITEIETDAIVNAANSGLLGGGGVDGAIHRKGGPEILAACRELRAGPLAQGLPAGHAVATTAGQLPARWVIHTVGPVYSPHEERSDVLRSCYRESLRVARELGAERVNFPLISAGVYGWPKADAITQAFTVLRAADQDGVATLVLFSTDLYEEAERQLSGYA
jgi:O-acetyl-ADP-ribose deacetylase (regulator of RNase III)